MQAGESVLSTLSTSALSLLFVAMMVLSLISMPVLAGPGIQSVDTESQSHDSIQLDDASAILEHVFSLIGHSDAHSTLNRPDPTDVESSALFDDEVDLSFDDGANHLSDDEFAPDAIADSLITAQRPDSTSASIASGDIDDVSYDWWPAGGTFEDAD